MPTYTVLGATGGTGSAILRSLISAAIPNLTIQILVRSRSKLLEAFPELTKNEAFRAIVREGTVSDTDSVLACVRGASVICVCIAPNKPSRNVALAQMAASQVQSALSQIKSENKSRFERPVVVFNRSLALSSTVTLGVPAPAKKMFAFAYAAVFDDIKEAEKIYHQAAKTQLMELITIDAPSLMNPESAVCTGYELLTKGQSSMTMNYADLGAAIVEIIQRHDEFAGMAIGISATGKVDESWGLGVAYMLLGLKNRMTPF